MEAQATLLSPAARALRSTETLATEKSGVSQAQDRRSTPTTVRSRTTINPVRTFSLAVYRSVDFHVGQDRSFKLFWHYQKEAQSLGLDTSNWGCWESKSVRRFLRYKLKSSVLANTSDERNELGLITERNILRWVRENVTKADDLKIPFGYLDNVNSEKLSQKGLDMWDMKPILQTSQF